ncbi:unnamed protein product [Ectocarpus sp. 13 AM-2016]
MRTLPSSLLEPFKACVDTQTRVRACGTCAYSTQQRVAGDATSTSSIPTHSYTRTERCLLTDGAKDGWWGPRPVGKLRLCRVVGEMGKCTLYLCTRFNWPHKNRSRSVKMMHAQHTAHSCTTPLQHSNRETRHKGWGDLVQDPRRLARKKT